MAQDAERIGGSWSVDWGSAQRVDMRMARDVMRVTRGNAGVILWCKLARAVLRSLQIILELFVNFFKFFDVSVDGAAIRGGWRFAEGDGGARQCTVRT